jgi:hypothetical protein
VKLPAEEVFNFLFPHLIRFRVYCDAVRSQRTPLHEHETTKALKKQAAKAQVVAQRASDAFVAQHMTTLAQPVRAQADAKAQKEEMKCLTP